MGLGNFIDWIWGARKAAAGGAFFAGSYPIPTTEADSNLAMNVASVYAAIHAYTEGISSMELAPCKADAEDFDPLTDHPLYSVLHDEFNPEETSQQAVAYAVASLLTRGNAYLQNISAGRKLLEIDPIDPDTVTPQRINGRKLYAIHGEPDKLAANQVLHVHINYDRKTLKGISCLSYAKTTIGLGLALDNFGYSYFTQGAQPRVVLKHPANLDEKQARQIVDGFNGMLAGPANANKTGILVGGADIIKLTLPPEEAQFLETRKFSVNEIARWFNLPPSRIGGERSSGTYANLEQDQRALIVHSLRPVCRMFEQEFDRKLLTPEERKTVRIRFDLDDLLAKVGGEDATATAPADQAAGEGSDVSTTEDANANE